MQTYRVELSFAPSDSFHAIKAANSVDLDTTKKLTHTLEISCDLPPEYNVGLIVGNSGSGKTTLAHEMFSEFNAPEIDPNVAIIDQFPMSYTYDDRARALNGIGLSSVPRWLRPVRTLLNGEQYRAQVAIALCSAQRPVVLDEWTSVVDRTVAQIMSHNAQKTIRKRNAQFVFLSCHFDIADWLKPDWIINCNDCTFRTPESYKKNLHFRIEPCAPHVWRQYATNHWFQKQG